MNKHLTLTSIRRYELRFHASSTAAAGFVSLMLVAAWTVHRPNGFFIVKEGWEHNLVLAVSGVVVATIGPGKLSLDWLIFGKNWLDGWQGLLLSVVLGLAGAPASC